MLTRSAPYIRNLPRRSTPRGVRAEDWFTLKYLEY